MHGNPNIKLNILHSEQALHLRHLSIKSNNKKEVRGEISDELIRFIDISHVKTT